MTLKRFVNNGLYLFPDGKVYVAMKPEGILWTFWTLEQWITSPGQDDTWVRFPDGKWMKKVRRTIKNRHGVQTYKGIDDKVLFTGTVLARKIEGKRLPKPDRDWFWKVLSFREREKYR